MHRDGARNATVFQPCFANSCSIDGELPHRQVDQRGSAACHLALDPLCILFELLQKSFRIRKQHEAPAVLRQVFVSEDAGQSGFLSFQQSISQRITQRLNERSVIVLIYLVCKGRRKGIGIRDGRVDSPVLLLPLEYPASYAYVCQYMLITVII